MPTEPSARRTAADISEDVRASFAACPDERLRVVLDSFVAHLHAFAEEVRLSPAEWEAAMTILTETGRITDEARNEFILWSDVLGLSMVVDALDDHRDPRATESTVEGPFWAPDSPPREYDESISERPGGVPLRLHGRVVDVDGNPIDDAELDVWQNGPNRLYAVQDPDAPPTHLRGRFKTRKDGSYSLMALRPTPYSIPDDGPVGAMLRATARSSWRPAHIHVAVSAEGYQPVVTHIFDAESEHLTSDAVFAVKPSLVRTLRQDEAADPTLPPRAGEPRLSAEVDFVLDRISETRAR